jgi:hypothetical protein
LIDKAEKESFKQFTALVDVSCGSLRYGRYKRVTIVGIRQYCGKKEFLDGEGNRYPIVVKDTPENAKQLDALRAHNEETDRISKERRDQATRLLNPITYLRGDDHKVEV